MRSVTNRLLWLGLLMLCAPVHADSTLTVPLRFHIVTGLVMGKSGVSMHSDIDPTDIEQIVLPEINRIWQPAGIVFSLDRVLRTPALNPPDRAPRIEYIVQATRDAEGHSDSARLEQLNGLVDWRAHSRVAINIYLVPYLGTASQGNASPKQLRVFAGLWTDKPSRGRQPPQPVALVEPLPFREGSLARTVAHEVGHILGLKHPDRSTQARFGLLMGGRQAGYDLTDADMHTARRQAARIDTLCKQSPPC